MALELLDSIQDIGARVKTPYKGAVQGDIWEPYYRATRLSTSSFDHGSSGGATEVFFTHASWAQVLAWVAPCYYKVNHNPSGSLQFLEGVL